MADVFISYSRHDKAHADRIAQALQAEGVSVWWDPAIMPHESFHDVIDRELDGAAAVLVVWSERSTDSRWVRSEATSGLERNEIIQVRVDGARPPRPFGQYQIADLSGWRGEADHRQWRMVVRSAKTLSAAHSAADDTVPDPSPVSTQAAPAPATRPGLSPALVFGGLAVVVVAIAGAAGVALFATQSGDGSAASASQDADAPEPLDPLQALRPSVVLVAKDGAGSGSGFFVGPDLVMTSATVIYGVDGRPGSYRVSNPALGVREAELVAVEGPGALGEADFGLLRVPGGRAVPLVFALGAHPTQPVVSTDYRPLAMRTFGRDGQAPPPTVLDGRIVGVQPVATEPVILHSIPLAPGTSGSPLTDACGRVLGVNVATTGVGGETLGVALRAEHLAGFARRNGASVSLTSGACP